MNTSIKKKWYDKKGVLILLLFLLPPIGIVGIFLRKTDLWKKLVYTFCAIIMSVVLLITILAIFNPINYLESGNRYFEYGNYEQAINEYKKVEANNKDYENALQKIQLAQNKLDSIFKVETLAREKQKQDSIAKKEKLTAFQKQWADSIVTSWEGEFIISYYRKSIDTIQFELSKGATEYFNSNVKSNLPMYQSMYEKSLKHNLNKANNEPKTIIGFVPNKELSANANPNEWQHPVMMNEGLKVYSGNQYSKTYVGTLNCKFKDPTDGKNYFVVLQSNGKDVMIENYKFREFYWVKKQDHKDRVGIGLNKCY